METGRADVIPPSGPLTRPGNPWPLGDHRLICRAGARLAERAPAPSQPEFPNPWSMHWVVCPERAGRQRWPFSVYESDSEHSRPAPRHI
jgi:hypothetical protein